MQAGSEPGTFTFVSEPGVTLSARYRIPAAGAAAPARLVVLANLDSENSDQVEKLSAACLAQGWQVLIPQLRATGSGAVSGDKIGNAPDHNSAQWGLWVGRPLLGQWAYDLQRAVTALESTPSGVLGSGPAWTQGGEVAVVGVGTAGPVVLCAAATDPRFRRVATVNSLASYISSVPYRGQRAGLMAPGIVRDVGDLPQVAALIAPRKLVIAGGVSGGGEALSGTELQAAWGWTRSAYENPSAPANLFIFPSEFDPAQLLKD
jgi:hypothetical protein